MNSFNVRLGVWNLLAYVGGFVFLLIVSAYVVSNCDVKEGCDHRGFCCVL